MSATVYYDRPANIELAADNNNTILPAESRNFAREGFATVAGTITFDNSYPTGGYGPMNNFGLKKLAGVLFEDVNGYGVYYNKSTDKVQVFTSGNTEVVAATDLHTLTAYFEAKGRLY